MHRRIACRGAHPRGPSARPRRTLRLLVALPDRRTLARPGDPDVRRRRDRRGARGRRRARSGRGRGRAVMGAGRDPRWLRRSLRQPASSTTSGTCAPLAKLVAQFAAVGHRDRGGPARRARHERRARESRSLSSGRSASRTPSTCSTTWTGWRRRSPPWRASTSPFDAATAHPNDMVLAVSLSLAFACLGFLPFNLRPGDGARVFMGDGGSQLLSILLAALGRGQAGRRPVRPSRRCSCRCSCLRSRSSTRRSSRCGRLAEAVARDPGLGGPTGPTGSQRTAFPRRRPWRCSR